MTLTQTVEIPANRRVHLDFEIPQEVPTGAIARLELVWSPEIEKAARKSEIEASLEKVQALLKDSPISVDSFLEERRRDDKLLEEKYKQLAASAGDTN